MIEAKEASNGCPKKIYDTISSFSNKYGGIIIFGISERDNFSICGVYDALDLQNKITDLCTDSMEPVIRPEIFIFEYGNKTLLTVKIKEVAVNLKPCYYKPLLWVLERVLILE